MDAAATARLEADGVALDAADVALLRTIAATGSVSAAAEDLGRSRARALARLDDLEAAFGTLVERTRGGADGGGSRLTDDAHALLARFERLRAALSGTAGAEEWVVAGDVVARDGELLTVATAVGEVRALATGTAGDDVDVPEGTAPVRAADADGDIDVGDAVQVAVRADAVTLQAAGATPDPDATSARNRLVGRVAAVDRGEAVATVTVAVDDADVAPLAAVLTLDSVARLGVEPGREVVATFKATATRAIATVSGG